MHHYLTAFIISLISTGAVMLILNRGNSDILRKRHDLLVALGMAVGLTLGEIVTDLWHPPYEILVRACIVAASTVLVPFPLTRRIRAHETPATHNAP
jgi:hypothetical protein